MKSTQGNRVAALSRVSSIGFAFVQLLSAALIGGGWFVLMGKLTWEAVVSSSLVALSVVIAVAWQQSRADARKRFLAALDAYAQREIAHTQVSRNETEIA
jgi:membrane protein implicated in regulation of membrane protease activity